MLTAEWMHLVLYIPDFTEFNHSRQNIILLFWKYLVDIRSEAWLNLFWEYCTYNCWESVCIAYSYNMQVKTAQKLQPNCRKNKQRQPC
jgi:hypothetical protein